MSQYDSLIRLCGSTASGNTHCHVAGIGIRANFADQRHRRRFCECLNSFFTEFLGEKGLAIVELLVQNDGWRLSTFSLGQSRITDSTEEEGISHFLRRSSESIA